MLLIPVFALVQDHRAARYGNGVFSHYAELAHGAYLTYINSTLITHGSTNDYAAIIWPGSTLTTEEGDTIMITKVKRYAVDQGDLYLAVESPLDRILVFASPEAVQEARPTTMITSSPLVWFDLEDKPFLVYYWRLIILILFLIEAALFASYLRRSSAEANL